MADFPAYFPHEFPPLHTNFENWAFRVSDACENRVRDVSTARRQCPIRFSTQVAVRHSLSETAETANYLGAGSAPYERHWSN